MACLPAMPGGPSLPACSCMAAAMWAIGYELWGTEYGSRRTWNTAWKRWNETGGALTTTSFLWVTGLLVGVVLLGMQVGKGRQAVSAGQWANGLAVGLARGIATGGALKTSWALSLGCIACTF